MSNSRYVYITVDEILCETEKALLCLIEGEEVWLPLSHIEENDLRVGELDCEIGITEFIAREKGLGA
jgi:hypothetical protein